MCASSFIFLVLSAARRRRIPTLGREVVAPTATCVAVVVFCWGMVFAEASMLLLLLFFLLTLEEPECHGIAWGRASVLHYRAHTHQA